MSNPQYTFKQGKQTVVIFPESFIQLNMESQHHPKLRMELSLHPADEWVERIAEVAAYCNIVLDGFYTLEQLDTLAQELYKILKSMREGHVHIVSGELGMKAVSLKIGGVQ